MNGDLITRLIEDDVIHELMKRSDGRYVLRPFFHDGEDDRKLSVHEAAEWRDAMSVVDREATNLPGD